MLPNLPSGYLQQRSHRAIAVLYVYKCHGMKRQDQHILLSVYGGQVPLLPFTK